MAILEVHNIEKHFGATRVLEDISFSLEQGDLEEDLALGHSQHHAGLLLSLGHALDAAPVDLGEVACVVEDKGY